MDSALITDQETADIIDIVMANCVCPKGEQRQVGLCSVCRLLDDPVQLAHLLFYRRCSEALIRGELLDDPGWMSLRGQLQHA